MHRQSINFITVVIPLTLGFYFVYTGNFLNRNSPQIPVSERVNVFEKGRFDLKKIIVKEVAGKGINLTPIRTVFSFGDSPIKLELKDLFIGKFLHMIALPPSDKTM